jgi:hypothetical protein
MRQYCIGAAITSKKVEKEVHLTDAWCAPLAVVLWCPSSIERDAA